MVGLVIGREMSLQFAGFSFDFGLTLRVGRTRKNREAAAAGATVGTIVFFGFRHGGGGGVPAYCGESKAMCLLVCRNWLD